MDAIKGNIIVSCDLSQKEETTIGGNILKSGKRYNENFREKNPVVAFVEKGNKEIQTGSTIVCNYNYFDLESPLLIFDNLYSIPVNEEIFAIINEDGSLEPVCGNLIVEEVEIENKIDLPEDLKKKQINQGKVLKGAFFEGRYVFWLPFSNYTICYNWQGKEKRAVKIHKNEVTGYLKID